MSDRLGFVPDSVKEGFENTSEGAKKEAKKTFRAFFSQIFGSSGETKKQAEKSQKIQEDAQKSNRTPEEQAKLESLRNKLHQQVTAPPPKPPEQARTEQEDQVGTNETTLQGNTPQGQMQALPDPILPPSSRRVERLKIRE